MVGNSLDLRAQSTARKNMRRKTNRKSSTFPKFTTAL